MSSPRRLAAVAAALAVAGSLVAFGQPAGAAPVWAPVSTARIRPGVQTVTGGSQQCTANFVFTDSAGAVYIGQAAHCASTSGPTQTNGCIANSMGLNTNVSVGGAQYPGKLVYSSWLTMKPKNLPTNAWECVYNDFALVKLDSRDWGKVNPTVPYFGGPTGLRTTGMSFGESVYSYGNSGLRLGLTQTSPKRGIGRSTQGDGWSHNVYTITQGIPGDSGSGFMDATGKAFGVLSTVSAAPLPLANATADLNLSLAYARANGFSSIQLALGTEPFGDPLL
jgi:hypothetical protein